MCGAESTNHVWVGSPQRAFWLTESQQRCRPYTYKPDAALNVATCITQAPLTGAVAL